jgi:hypothetical protein
LRPRLSIAGLMAAVLLLAVGFAGLRTASALWASALFTLTVILLAAASLGVAVSRRQTRMACLGFSLFGWIYLLTTFWLWPGPNGVSAPPFLTKSLLDAVQPASQTPAAMTIDAGPAGELSTESPLMVETTISPGLTGMTPYAGRVINLLHYRRIGHMLAAIGFGLLGGLLGTIGSAMREAGEGRHPDRFQKTERSSDAAS